MAEWMTGRPVVRQGGRRIARQARGPIEQMLMVVIPGCVAKSRMLYPYPFIEAVPGFFDYLVSECGLRPMTVDGYRHHLRRFELFLARIGVARLSELSPSILSAFVADRATATLRSLAPGRDGKTYAVCDLEGRRIVALSGQHLASRVGGEVELVYSRVDADGSLRGAHLLGAGTSPRRSRPSRLVALTGRPPAIKAQPHADYCLYLSDGVAAFIGTEYSISPRSTRRETAPALEV